jgi:hypothetical protein
MCAAEARTGSSVLQPFPINRFGGLDLREAEEVGAQSAIDLLNVDFDRTGAVRTRDGVVAFNATPAASAFTDGRVWAGATLDSPQIIFSDFGGDLRAYSATGTLLATLALSHDYVSLAALGTGSAGPYVYIGGDTGSQIRRWDGSAFSSPAGMPNARLVAVQPNDNRLVAAHTDATNERSRVKFSDANAPETWTANNFVDLHPNDGGEITAMVTWRDALWVFKSTGKIFQFYGNSVDAANNPVFNYRTIDTPGVSALVDGVEVCPEGLYINAVDGIYLLGGVGAPRKISGALDSLFEGRGTPFFQGATGLVPLTYFPQRPIAWQDSVLFPSSTSPGASNIVLVFHRPTEQWSYWSFPNGLVPFGVIPPTATLGLARLLLVKEQTTAYRLSTSATDDAGTAIVSRYRSGFYGVGGQPSQEAVIRESVLDGIGTPTFSVSKDYGAVPTTGGGAKAAVTLGTAPAYGNNRHRVAQKGRRFSFQIEATSGAWRVNQITHHVRGIRPPGVKST